MFHDWALGGEAISSRILLAAAVIVAGVAIVTWASEKEKEKEKESAKPAEIAAAICEMPAAT